MRTRTPNTTRARRVTAGALATGMVAAATVVAGTPAAADDHGEGPQYPFACTAQDHGLELIVDNEEGEGVEVFDDDGVSLGWSRDCDADTRTWYQVIDTEGGTHVVRGHGEDGPASLDAALPEGVEPAMIEPDGVDAAGPVPYLIRHERGVLNRFIYSVSMLAPVSELTDGDPDEPDHDLWNGRLLYQFQGGVGIGHSQGRYDDRGITGRPDRLSHGEAVIYSTATRTGDHYDLLVGGRTAEEVKDHFVTTHGEPRATVSLGSSGGGIQAYVYAQNHPGLLDGAVAQESYPDMTTQTIHVGDCALLDRWMDLDAEGDRWDDWDERRLLQGLNSIEGYLGSTARQLAGFQEALGQTPQTGSSECLEGWFGLAPLAMNPTFGEESNWDLLGDQVDDIERTHWDDAVEAYGRDPETGYARVPWDNVGVQYGLRALADGELSGEEFLDLNARVGSWKDTPDMVEEGFPFVGAPEDVFAGTIEYDPWSARNMQLSEDDGVTPAPRRSGDEIAIAGAYESGLVTLGDVEREIPIVDVRQHMEHVLDMHNVHQSFAARQRLLDGQGHADNQAIWFLSTDGEGDSPADADVYGAAVDTVHDWIEAMGDDRSPGDARPSDAEDRCFEVDGQVLAAGADVWDGILDDGEEGACTQEFEIHTTSRIEAGGPITGDVYKCHTMPVGTAVAEGLYGDWTPDDAALARLRSIHPDGVCDYGLRGVADPRGSVAAAVVATGGAGTVTADGAVPGATVEVRQDGEVVTGVTADDQGRAVIADLDAGDYVVAQRIEGQRGSLSEPVTVVADDGPQRVLTCPPAGGPAGFDDVPTGSVHAEAIGCGDALGLLHGKVDGRFAPADPLTRAQAASVIDRIATATGRALPDQPRRTFPDVPAGPHRDAIERLAGAEVIRGFEDGTFRHGEPVTRGQLATLLVRFLDDAGVALELGEPFPDVAEGTELATVLRQARSIGVFLGSDDGSARPSRSIPRDQAASLFVRSLGALPLAD